MPAVARASTVVKAPRSNSTRMMGPAAMNNATAAGIIEPRDHAVLKAGDDGRDDDGDLRHAAGNEPGHGEAHETLHLGSPSGAFELETKPCPGGGEGDDGDLQQPGDGYAPGQRHTGDGLLARAGGDQSQQDG